MASISGDFDVAQVFPTSIGQYQIEFSREEEETIKKFTDPEYYTEHSIWVDGGKGRNVKFNPYDSAEKKRGDPVWDDDFLILYVGSNLLTHPEWHGVRDAIEDICNHYVRTVLGMAMPENASCGVADSWIIKTTNTHDYPIPYHRKHNHSFAWLTGILYLDDSPNGTVLHCNEEFETRYLPFAWPQTDNEWNANNWATVAKKGKVIIFPAKMNHSIMNNADGSVRHTLPFNIFPFGEVNSENAAQLYYQQTLKR